MVSTLSTWTLASRLTALALLAPPGFAQQPNVIPTPHLTTAPPASLTGSPGYANCSASCMIQYPDLFEYTWSSVSYADTTVAQVTVATLIYLIDTSQGITRTSTKYAAKTELDGLPSPGAPNSATITLYRGKSSETSIVTYPTPVLDYYPEYTIVAGVLPTRASCKTISSEAIYTPSTHASLPIPSALLHRPARNDSLGFQYALILNSDFSSSPTPTGLPQSFYSWYRSQYNNEGGVRSCKPLAFAGLELTAPSIPSFPAASTASSPPSLTSPLESPLTHTSVQYLTATQTSHVQIPIGGEEGKTSLQPDKALGSASKTSQGGGGLAGVIASLVPGIISKNGGTPAKAGDSSGATPSASIEAGHKTYGVTPTAVVKTVNGQVTSVGAVVVDGHTVAVGGSSVNIHGTPVRLTIVTSGDFTSTAAVVGHGGGAFGGAVQSSIPVSFPTAKEAAPGASVEVGHQTFSVTPTAVATTIKGQVTSVPAVVVDGHTIPVGGSSVNIHGTPVVLTVITSGGLTMTEAIVGHGGGAFGGAVQSSVPVSFPTVMEAASGAFVEVGHQSFSVTPTAVATTINGQVTSVPAVVVDGHTITVGGSSVNIHGTPVVLTVVTSGGSTMTEAVVGYGGGAFGGSVQSSVLVSFPKSSSVGVGNYVNSGLGGSGTASTGTETNSGSAQFTGAADRISRGDASLFGLVVAGVVGALI